MLKLKKIAVTGGAASGKSSVCRYFQELGAYVVDTDVIVHKLLSPNTALGQKIIPLIGKETVINGTFSRKAIAEKVFRNPQLLSDFEKLLHPEVLHYVEALYKKIQSSDKYTAFVVEVPLLFESNQASFYDIILSVISDRSVSKERFQKAGFSSEEYERRMSRQLDPYEKAQRAHFIINNNGSLEFLKRQVSDLYFLLQQQ